jgi:hypothetical protein
MHLRSAYRKLEIPGAGHAEAFRDLQAGDRLARHGLTCYMDRRCATCAQAAGVLLDSSSWAVVP